MEHLRLGADNALSGIRCAEGNSKLELARQMQKQRRRPGELEHAQLLGGSVVCLTDERLLGKARSAIFMEARNTLPNRNLEIEH